MSRTHPFAQLPASRCGAKIEGQRSRKRRTHGRNLRIESLEERRLLSITVNTLDDENDGVDVGGISLRDAIAAAPANETIDFAPALTSSGPATILLTRGELVINKDLTINGPGAYLLTIDASGNDPTRNVKDGNGSRVFHINDGANSLKTVAISRLRLTGGDASGPGGGILARENLTLVDCAVDNNATLTNSQLGGGGIYSASTANASNSLTLIDCSITNNAAVRDEGGGIRKQRGTLVMEGCTVSGNTAMTHGGGLSAADGSVNIQIRACTFDANTAISYYGGGIFVYSGIMTLSDSTLSGNSATYGAGLYLTTTSQGTVTGSTISNNSASVDGGGVYVISSQLTITDGTLSGNAAQGFGGAAVANGTLILRHSTVTANRANSDNVGNEQGGGVAVGTGEVTFDHTIVAGNLRGTSTRSDATGPFAARFSLIGDNTGATITDNGGNLIGTGAAPRNPMLGPLANNGGPTRTHALLPGSSAIDAGDPAALAGMGGVPSSDQRGARFTRIFDGAGDSRARIDVGAFEVQPAGLAANFDLDQDCDGADFLIWQRGLGLTGAAATHDVGNADSDNDVDSVDWAIWITQYGVSATMAASAAESTAAVSSPMVASVRSALVDAAMAYYQRFVNDAAPRGTSKMRLMRMGY